MENRTWELYLAIAKRRIGQALMEGAILPPEDREKALAANAVLEYEKDRKTWETGPAKTIRAEREHRLFGAFGVNLDTIWALIDGDEFYNWRKAEFDREINEPEDMPE